MKKVLVLTVIVFLAFAGYGQRNEFYYGDNNAKNSKEILSQIDKTLDSYAEEVKNLENENSKLRLDFSKSTNTAFVEYVRDKLMSNDSLIVWYRQEIITLNSTKTEYLQKIASSSRRGFIRSRGMNPAKVTAAAEAYAIVAYTDAQIDGMRTNTQTETGLRGVAVNNWYREAVVIVNGPGSFRISSNVSAKGGTFEFEVPYPGRYTFTFSDGRDTRSVDVNCRPGQYVYYHNGDKYDLKATLPRAR